MPPKKRNLKRSATVTRAQMPDEADLSGDKDLGSSCPPSAREVAGKKEKPRQQPLHLTLEQQDDVVTWFIEHELLYDKGHADYKLTEKKSALWKEKADELSVCDGPRLKCWVDSLRTQYGKLTKRASGSGGRLSDRDKWILDKFSFLSRHIYRIPSRSGVDLISKIREKHPERMHDSEESNAEEENVEDKLPSTSPALSTTSMDKDTPVVPKKKKKTGSDESTAFLQRLEQRIQQSSNMQEKLLDQLSAPTDTRVAERRQWAQWFGAAITEIDDSLWSEFQTESLQLVNSFKIRSKHVKPATVQSVQQERVDYDVARRLQTLNYSTNPGGYLPIWQQQYQTYQPLRHVMHPLAPANLSRSHSAPLSATATSPTLTITPSVSSVMATAGPTRVTADQATRTDVSHSGQNNALGELINFSGISAIDASSDVDINVV